MSKRFLRSEKQVGDIKKGRPCKRNRCRDRRQLLCDEAVSQTTQVKKRATNCYVGCCISITFVLTAPSILKLF